MPGGEYMIDFMICALIMLATICSYINVFIKPNKFYIYASIFFDVLAFIIISAQLIK